MTTRPMRWKIRDKRRFLIALLTELAGDAYVSFEGELSCVAVSRLPGASGEETSILKRNTLWPRQDFVVLPLESDNVQAIGIAIGGTLPKAIIHIQIEKSGRLELGVYDNFGGIVFGPALTPAFLSGLQSDGVIAPWTESSITVALRCVSPVTLLGSHGWDFIYHFGAVGIGEVDAGGAVAFAGGGVGFLHLVYDAGAARLRGRWPRVPLYAARDLRADDFEG